MPDLWLTEEGDPWLAEDGSLLVLESDDGAPTAATAATVTLTQNRSTNAYYWIGDVPVFTATFSPATDTGVYTFTAPELTQSGLHTCRVDGTDPTGAAERSIGVRQSRFANP